MTKPLPNWDIWLHMPMLTTHQAVCLSFGLDPSKVHAYDHKEKSWGWLGNRLFNAVSDFNDRRTLFSACHPKGLSPEQLSKWAQSVNWNIPTMLADLAPVPVDAPDTLPAETVRAALVEIIGAGADIEELKKEIERTGITFSMRDGVETMEIPDGNLRGRRTPLSGLYNELSAIFYTMPKGSKLGSLMRASGASGSGAQPSYGLSHTPQKLALTTAIPEAQAAALAPVGNNEIEALAWKQLAQNKAHEIIAADGKRDWYPSQENIADRIAVQFREAVPQVVGGGGKPLTGAYIKRHALRGISSEQGKRRSTIPRRGK